MVGTFQEILDASSGNWVRIKSIADLRVLSFLGSSEAKYSSTELNFGRFREHRCYIVLRSTSIHDFCAGVWLASDSRLLNVAMKLSNAVRKSLQSQQPERHLMMPRCNKGSAFPDERRHDGDDELFNRVLVQQGPDDIAAAHHPDVLASLLA